MTYRRFHNIALMLVLLAPAPLYTACGSTTDPIRMASNDDDGERQGGEHDDDHGGSNGGGDSGGAPSGDDSGGAPSDGGGSGGSGGGSTNGGGSSHNAGANCLQSGCHASGSRTFTYAGTLYASPSGGATTAGGSVTIIQNDGTTISLTSDGSGNFYTSQGNASSGYTAVAGGTMITNATNGGCNASGCHASMRVY